MCLTAPVQIRALDAGMASVALPESVRRAVEAEMAGDALDAAAERAARDAGWRTASSVK